MKKAIYEILDQITTNMGRMALLFEDITTAVSLSHIRQNIADARLDDLEERIEDLEHYVGGTD